MRKFLAITYLIASSLMFAADEEAITEIPVIPEETLIAAVDEGAPGLLSDGALRPNNDDAATNPFVLRNFIESKGLISCREKSGLLTIAGDVRARWLTAAERENDRIVRSAFEKTGINAFKAEVNLFFDYVGSVSWLTTKLRWINFEGIDGGTPTRIELDRAFIGYDIHETKQSDFYIELGRSRLDYMFESRVEFGSSFTGIHLYYTNCFPGIGSLIVHGGPFIVDSFNNHYAWVGEIFFKELAGSPWGVKYSIIDWERGSPTRYFGKLPNRETLKIKNNPRYQFVVSQLLIGYQRPIDICHCKNFYAYAAVLANTAAKRRPTTGNRYMNKAWYAGFTLGKLCKRGDWSLDLLYQYVQAQAVPEFDVAGFGHGNDSGALFSDAFIIGQTPFLAHGFTNFKGWGGSLLYAMTDSLSLRMIAARTTPCTVFLGGDFLYKSFEMSLIYAF